MNMKEWIAANGKGLVYFSAVAIFSIGLALERISLALIIPSALVIILMTARAYLSSAAENRRKD
jgi:cytosine/uracil/thiamine/allantoin permease